MNVLSGKAVDRSDAYLQHVDRVQPPAATDCVMSDFGLVEKTAPVSRAFGRRVDGDGLGEWDTQYEIHDKPDGFVVVSYLSFKTFSGIAPPDKARFASYVEVHAYVVDGTGCYTFDTVSKLDCSAFQHVKELASVAQSAKVFVEYFSTACEMERTCHTWGAYDEPPHLQLRDIPVVLKRTRDEAFNEVDTGAGVFCHKTPRGE